MSSEFEIIQVAIELARLNDSKRPEDYLAASAKLFRQAADSAANERTRPDRELRAKAETGIMEDWKAQLVPWDKIFRPGKKAGGAAEQDEFEDFPNPSGAGATFHWKVFTTLKGFDKLLRKHWDEHLQIAYGALAEDFKSQAADGVCEGFTGKVVTAIIERGWWIDPDVQKKLECAKTLAALAKALDQWWDQAAVEVPKRFLAEARAGRLSVTTVHELFLTRKRSDKEDEDKPELCRLEIVK